MRGIPNGYKTDRSCPIFTQWDTFMSCVRIILLRRWRSMRFSLALLLLLFWNNVFIMPSAFTLEQDEQILKRYILCFFDILLEHLILYPPFIISYSKKVGLLCRCDTRRIPMQSNFILKRISVVTVIITSFRAIGSLLSSCRPTFRSFFFIPKMTAVRLSL